MGAEIASILAIGGPSSIVGIVVWVLLKAWFDSKKEKREDETHQNTTETGIIDNTKRVMELVRGETDRLEKKVLNLEQRLDAEEEVSRKARDEADRQRRRAEGLEEEVQRLEKRVEELERYGRTPSA